MNVLLRIKEKCDSYIRKRDWTILTLIWSFILTMASNANGFIDYKKRFVASAKFSGSARDVMHRGPKL